MNLFKKFDIIITKNKNMNLFIINILIFLKLINFINLRKKA